MLANKRKARRVPIRLILLVAICLLTSVSFASEIINSNGFESPEYTTGDLIHQQGWLRASNQALGTATVQSAITHSGTQAIRVDRAANSDDRWAVPVTGFPTSDFVRVDWDMRVEESTAAANVFGPFFGAEAYDSEGDFGLLGSLGVDAKTGDVLYQVEDTGYLTASGSAVGFGVWHHYQLVFDFSADEYYGYVDGNQVSHTGFVNRGFGFDNFSDADISTFGAAGDSVSQALTGTAYFDNFVVRDAALGDFDFDGDVDGTDFLTWQAAYNTNANGDANFDGVTNAADFTIWEESYGIPSAALLTSSSVPEPTSLLLSILFALGLVAFTHKR